MKKALALSVTALTLFSLAGCGSQSSKGKPTHQAATSSKPTKHKHHAKHKAKASSSSSSSASGQNSQQQGQQAQATQPTRQATNQAPTGQQSKQQAQGGQRINNAQDAVNAARAKYGDNGGDYMWGAMQSDSGTQNPDGSYFVKAISRQQQENGSMTGTAQSVRVYPDGTIASN